MKYKIREIYVTDGYYLLTKLTEEDKDRYMELANESSVIKNFYDNLKNSELMWRVALKLDEINYSIFDNKGQYCGNIILKHPKETTPEIGIDLLKSKQNQGIAPRCVKMLACQIYQERRDVEYILLRVSSLNSHSKHMIEKLGAIYDGEEETMMQRAIKILDKEIDDMSKFKTRDFYEEYCTEYPEEADEVVYRYRLMAEAVMEKGEER